MMHILNLSRDCHGILDGEKKNCNVVNFATSVRTLLISMNLVGIRIWRFGSKVVGYRKSAFHGY